MHPMTLTRSAFFMGVAMAAPSFCQAAEAQVAVAANFAEPIKAVAAVLEKTTGHTLKVTVGATGKFYAQIQNGAPFDVLLAADTHTPQKLEAEGLAVSGTRFTYATGKLVLWSVQAGRVDGQGQILQAGNLGKVSYANPKVAPYGAATIKAIDAMGLTRVIAPKLVQGESIAQAYAFTATGNADVGFVALSQVLEAGRLKNGSMWVVPQRFYDPIRQDAVLLKKGQTNEAAQALLRLLQSTQIDNLIRSYGYER